MPVGSGDYQDEGDEIDVLEANHNASQWWCPVTELETFDLGTCDVNGSDGEYGDESDADEEEYASQANDGSTQNV